MILIMTRKFKHKFHQYQHTNNHFSSLIALQMIKNLHRFASTQKDHILWQRWMIT